MTELSEMNPKPCQLANHRQQTVAAGNRLPPENGTGAQRKQTAHPRTDSLTKKAKEPTP